MDPRPGPPGPDGSVTLRLNLTASISYITITVIADPTARVESAALRLVQERADCPLPGVPVALSTCPEDDPAQCAAFPAVSQCAAPPVYNPLTQ